MTATRYLENQNVKYPDTLVQVPPDQWPSNEPTGIDQVWRSKKFLVQVYAEKDGAVRLSICRVIISKSGHWQDGITWMDLQRLKAECGYGDRWAVEIYPPNDEVVNVANMRHLFVLGGAPAYAWQNTT